MRTRTIAISALSVTFALLFASPAMPRDLISVSVNGVEQASGSSFIDLVDDALSQEGAFQNLASLTTYDIAVDYLGIQDAIIVNAVNNGSTVTLSIPTIGFSQIFVGASPDDVEDQVEDFFESSGADTLAKFLEEVNGRSPLAVLDGNPRSTTALLSRGAYDRFGLGAQRSRVGYRRADVARWGHFDLQVEGSGGTLEVDGFDSFAVADGALTLAGDFKPGIGISFSLLGQYRDLDGSDVYDGGIELAVPVHILAPSSKGAFRWVVTPFVQVGAGVAVDLAAGGLMVGGGAVNSVAYNFSSFEVMMANEIVYYGGVPIDDIGGYDFDTDLDRLALKNGGKLAYHLSHYGFVEGGVTFTNFLAGDAAVDFYTTPFAGVGLSVGILRLRVGWESDFGDEFEAHIGKGEIGLQF